MANVRSKVASRISKIKEADDFNFSNWLKKPVLHHHPVEAISSYLANLGEQQIEFIFPDHLEYKFGMLEPDVTDELKNCEFKRVRSNAIFFMIADVVENSFVFKNVDIRPRSYSLKQIEFLLKNPRAKTFKVKFDDIPPSNYEFVLPIPTIFDYLSNLVTEVLKIDLLDFEDLASSSKKVKVKNVEILKFKKSKVEKLPLPGMPDMKKTFRIKVPSMGTYKFSQKQIKFPGFSNPTISDAKNFQLVRGKNFYANFNLSVKPSILYYLASSKTKDKSDKTVSSLKGNPQLQDQLKYILSNVKRIDWEKNVRLHIKLKKYEEAGAKFLAENKFALLQDEFGIDSEKEAVAALKILFGNRAIKSALIITDFTKLGNQNFAKHLNQEIGWSDKIQKHCPDLDFSIIRGNNDERAEMWEQSRSILLADIDIAVNDFRMKLLDEKRLDKFDCIVLDSVDSILFSGESGTELLASIKPKILWAISPVINKNIQHDLNKALNPEVQIDHTLIRDKASIMSVAPRFILNEFWCETDEKQAAEFNTALVEARKDLRRVLESGNPLRFAANIFTLYHKLNQLGNFVSGKSISPKADLLLHHIKNIKDNGKKVLILSQYEKLGIKKISELLNDHQIKNVLAPNGLSAEALIELLNDFNQKKDVVAFISDAKISRLKLSDVEIPYLINFDQWWSPMLNWELEDMFARTGDEAFKESTNLLNYFSTGTLDQKVREMLLKGDLLNRNVFELMQPKLYEELITIDEWLDIFGMPVSGDSKLLEETELMTDVILKMTIDEFRKVLIKFFTLIGYSEVDILELPNSNSFNLIGRAQRNNRSFYLNARVILENKINKSALENIIAETDSRKQDKIFVIARTTLPKIDETKLHDNVTLLDGNLLSKFLVRVGISLSQK